MSHTFMEFEVNHIPMEENVRDDVLARLASTKGSGLNKTIIQGTLKALSTEVEEVMKLDNARGWMVVIIRYLT